MCLSLHPLSCWCMVAMCLCVIRSVMEKSFLEYYDFYEGVCKERLYLQGQNMQVRCAYLYLYWFFMMTLKGAASISNNILILISIPVYAPYKQTEMLLKLVFILASDSGSFRREAGPLWLPGPPGSPQCHPQENPGETPGRGRAQRKWFRLGHQLIWDRPRQPGKLPPLTPWTVQESEVRPRTKVKGNIFCFIWSEGGKKQSATIYSMIKSILNGSM